MSRASTILQRCLFMAALSAVIAGCDRNEAPQAAAPQRPAPPVTTAAAIAQDVPVYIDAIGKTVATNVVSVVPQVSGKVTATYVEDGVYVKKGQLLFEIDPRPFEAALAAKKAALAQNVAELAWAEADFRRTDELRSQNVATQLEYEQKKSTADADRAKIEAAKADIQKAELDLEYTKIYSPIDGRAGVRVVDPGNVVKENEGTMLMIQRMDPIYAEFTVTENDLGTVRKFMVSRGMEVGNESDLGLRALVEVPGDSAQLLAALGRGSPTTQPLKTVGPREGTLTFLDNTVQNNTGTVKLRASIPNSDHYFWPGQFVNVRLVLTTRKDAVLIPIVAEQIGQQGPYVYVVKADQTAEMRPVVAGQRQKDMLVIESGVSAGEQVITGGHMMVAPGGKVTVTNAAPTSAPAVATR